MTVEIISWSISTKVWEQVEIEIATPGSAVRHTSVARHVTRSGVNDFSRQHFQMHFFHSRRRVKINSYAKISIEKTVYNFQTFTIVYLFLETVGGGWAEARDYGEHHEERTRTQSKIGMLPLSTFIGADFVCLFYLILYVPVNSFLVMPGQVFLVQPVLSNDKCVLLKDHNTVTPLRLKPAAPLSRANTLPLSHCTPYRVWTCCFSSSMNTVTDRRFWSGSKLFVTLKVFLKKVFEKLNFEKKSADDN